MWWGRTLAGPIHVGAAGETAGNTPPPYQAAPSFARASAKAAGVTGNPARPRGIRQRLQATPAGNARRPAEAVRAAVGSGGAGSFGCVPGQLSKPRLVHRGRGTEPGACSACGALEVGVTGMRFTQPEGTPGKSGEKSAGELQRGGPSMESGPGITPTAQW